MTRKCLGRAVLALGTALAIGVPAGADDLTDRIDRMERELQELKREMQRRNAGAPAAAPAPAAPTTVEAPPPAAPPPAVATAPAPQKAGAAQDAERVIEAVTSRVNIGAYGSMRYEASNIDEAHSTFTFRRFVLTADGQIAPRLKAAMELEFERFRELELEKKTETADGGLTVEQTVEGTSDSEIALEQAWLQYDFTDWIGMQLELRDYVVKANPGGGDVNGDRRLTSADEGPQNNIFFTAGLTFVLPPKARITK